MRCFLILLIAAVSIYAVQPVDLRGLELSSKIRVSKPEKILSKDDKGLSIVARPNYATAFYMENVDWDISNVKQLAFTVYSKVPGYFDLVFALKDGNQEFAYRNYPLSIIPDGKEHTLVYDVSTEPTWRGKVTNWELRWKGESGEIGLTAMAFSPVPNLIPDAISLKPGIERDLALVMPRSKCRLHWLGGKSPGVTLRFYDRALKEIGSQKLLPGQDAVVFNMPEMMIRTTASIDGASEGIPVLELLEYKRPFAQSTLEWRGQWIWSQKENGPDDVNVWFEKVIELESAPEYAAISALGDDYSWFYINGRYAGKTSAWRIPGHFDITNMLKPGTNHIRVRVYNANVKAGLLADGYIKLKDKEIIFQTDSTWKCNTTDNTSSGIPTVYDKPVVELGDAKHTKPWNLGIGYSYSGPRGQLTLLSAEPGKMKVRVDSLPVMPLDRMRFATVDGKGKERIMDLPISPGSASWKVGGVSEISYPMPKRDAPEYRLYLKDDYVGIAGNAPLAEIKNQAKKAPQLKMAKLHGNGRPYLQFGDEHINGMFWPTSSVNSANYAPNNELSQKCGYRYVRCCTRFIDYWKGEDNFDFSSLDSDIDQLLTFNPNAVIIIIVRIDMPDWWLAKNPREESVHYGNHKRDRFELDAQALGSKKWLQDAEIPLKALVDHVKSKGYADKICSVSFGSGCNLEWFWSNHDVNKQRSWAGYAPGDYDTFRSYLREKYGTNEKLAKAWGQEGLTFETIEMPSTECMYKSSVGILYDAAKDRRVIDWYDFRNRAFGEAISTLGQYIKRETGGKWLVGAYYGYNNELCCNSTNPLPMSGHNGFWYAVKSPYVDYVHAPSRYLNRKTGLGDYIMQTWDSWLLHGKMIYVEQDSRLAYGPNEHNNGRIYAGFPDTAVESVGQLDRAFGMTLATGTLSYWLDILCGAYHEKAMHDILREYRELTDKLPPVKGTTPFETAVVSDIDSIYYAKCSDADGVFVAAMGGGIMRHFNRLAVPYRSLTINDLLDKDISVPAHKLYIMLPTLVLSKERRQLLMERFEREGATVVWLYAAGSSYPEQGPSGDNCGDFLGIGTDMLVQTMQPEMWTTADYGSLECRNFNASSPWFFPVKGFDQAIGKDTQDRNLLVRKKIGKANHYFSTLMNLPVELYSIIMDKAGVRRYMKGTQDFCWIGNDVLFIYAVTGGRRSLDIPDGYVAKGIIGPCKGLRLRKGDEFDMTAAMTYGFVLEAK